jgi:uncharacterized protein YbaP (TraB family)
VSILLLLVFFGKKFGFVKLNKTKGEIMGATSGILEQWARLGPGQYFTRDLTVTTDKAQKISLTEAFNRSAEVLRKDTVIRPIENGIFDRVIRVASDRFSKVFGQMGWFDRSRQGICLKRSFARYMDQLAETIMNGRSQVVRIKMVVERCLTLPPSPARDFGLNHLVPAMARRVEASTVAHPPIYEISDQGGRAKGYLIGTCHTATVANCAHSDIWPILDRCGELVCESDSGGLLFLYDNLRCARSPAYASTVAPLDIAMAHRARGKEIPVSGLESSWTSHKIAYHSIYENTVWLLTESQAVEASLAGRMGHLFVLRAEMKEAWLRGDEEELSSWTVAVNCPKTVERVFNQRNVKWLAQQDGILAKLGKASSDKPLCIAVGAAHLCGAQGLVEGLRAKGFVVQRQITP